MKDKLIEIWLWAVAVAFTVAAICTFAAWERERSKRRREAAKAAKTKEVA